MQITSGYGGHRSSLGCIKETLFLSPDLREKDWKRIRRPGISTEFPCMYLPHPLQNDEVHHAFRSRIEISGSWHIVSDALFAPCGRAEAAQNETADILSVCQINSSTVQPFEGKMISAKGIIMLTGEGEALLTDHSCSDEFVRLRFPAGFAGGPHDKNLGNLLFHPRAGTVVGDEIYCICSGEIEYEALQPILHVDKVERVWSVRKR